MDKGDQEVQTLLDTQGECVLAVCCTPQSLALTRAKGNRRRRKLLEVMDRLLA